MTQSLLDLKSVLTRPQTKSILSEKDSSPALHPSVSIPIDPSLHCYDDILPLSLLKLESRYW